MLAKQKLQSDLLSPKRESLPAADVLNLLRPNASGKQHYTRRSQLLNQIPSNNCLTIGEGFLASANPYGFTFLWFVFLYE